MKVVNYRIAPTLIPKDILDEWRWLIGPTLKVYRVTKAGDATLYDPIDGSIHFLDTMEGSIDRVASNIAGWESAIAARENMNKWLKPWLVDGQALLGMRLKSRECLSFKIPQALGGQLHPDNIEACDVTVHFSISGQIHRQIKDLPPGTPIGEIKIEMPGRSTRPWWKLW